MKPTQADWDSLARYLAEIHDALVEIELVLHDHHFTLDCTERRTAEREAFQLIELARAKAKGTESGH